MPTLLAPTAWRRITVCLLTLLTGEILGAQTANATQRRSGWLPRVVQWQGATPVQRSTAMATLERFEQMLLQVPGLAQPVGYEVEPAFAGGHRPLGPGGTPIADGLIRYNLGLTMFYPRRAQAEGRTCISFVVNDDAPVAGHRDSTGREFFVEGDRGTPIPGATQVLGGLAKDQTERNGTTVIFTAAGVQPWRQATRGELLNALIFEAEGSNGAQSAELKSTFAKTPYQEWMEGAAQRKRDREVAIAQSGLGAVKAKEMREQLEAVERDATERMRADDAAVRERFSEARRAVDKSGADLRATLAAMTPAERRMPAMVNNALLDSPMVGGYHLTTDTMPPAWRILTTQYDFWRARRSPVEVRSIRVTFVLSGTCLQPQVQQAVREAFDRIDWKALRDLLEVPR